MKIPIFGSAVATGRQRRPARPSNIGIRRNGDNLCVCAQQLSYDATMWQKANSGDRGMVRENIALGSARRGGDVADRPRGPARVRCRPSKPAGVRMHAPIPVRRVASMRPSHNRLSVAVEASGANTSSRSRHHWIRPSNPAMRRMLGYLTKVLRLVQEFALRATIYLTRLSLIRRIASLSEPYLFGKFWSEQ